MSNRDICLQIINGFKEEQLLNIKIMLQSMRDLISEAEDSAFCEKLLEEYENDTDLEKDRSVSIENFAKELGIVL